MELLTALSLICTTFIAYVVLSMQHQNKLIDKVLAKDYKEYKQEQRADEQQKARIEVEKLPTKEEENDPYYL